MTEQDEVLALRVQLYQVREALVQLAGVVERLAVRVDELDRVGVMWRDWVEEISR